MEQLQILKHIIKLLNHYLYTEIYIQYVAREFSSTKHLLKLFFYL